MVQILTIQTAIIRKERTRGMCTTDPVCFIASWIVGLIVALRTLNEESGAQIVKNLAVG